MSTERVDELRKLLEQHLTRLGRDDLGVGEVRDAGPGRLEVEFIKGGLRRTAELAIEDLGDPERARAAMNTALLRISKEVERHHIEAAQRG